MFNEIKELCSKIKDKCTCHGCGGAMEVNRCTYCQTKDEELEVLEEALIKVLNNIEINESILLELYTIRSLKLKEVNSILIENEFKEFLDNKCSELINNARSDKLSLEDYRYIKYFIDNDLLDKNTNMSFLNQIMKGLILGKCNLSFEEVKEFIIKYTETVMTFMHKNVKNPKCIFEESEERLGASAYNMIFLNEEFLDESINNNEYINILEIILHECTHTFQNYRTKSKGEELNYNDILQSKERIIRSIYKEYYNENYAKVSYEVEARYNSYASLLHILNSYGINLSEEKKEHYLKSMELEMLLSKDETRTLNGKATTVDEVFESLELDINVARKYPALFLEYKIVDDKLVTKSKEELMKEFMQLDSDSTLVNDTYMYLIKKASNKSIDKTY